MMFYDSTDTEDENGTKQEKFLTENSSENKSAKRKIKKRASQKEIDDAYMNFVASAYILDLEILTGHTKKYTKETMIPKKYEQCLKIVKPLIMEAIKICLTMHTWEVNSEYQETYIVITAHFLNDKFKFRTVVLECKNMYVENEEAEEVEFVASKFLEITNHWGIKDKINFAVGDKQNLNKIYDVNKWEHYNCMAVTLEKIVKTALNLIKDTKKKVWNIVCDIKYDEEANKRLIEKAKKREGEPIRLKTDISEEGNWYFTIIMIDRFSQMEQTLKEVILTLNKELPIITEDEWKILKEIGPALDSFKTVAQQMCKEHYVPASMALVFAKFLLESCGKYEIECSNEIAHNVVATLKNGIFNAFFKEINKNLVACTFLDPRFKKHLSIDGIDVNQIIEEKIKHMLNHKEFKDKQEPFLNTALKEIEIYLSSPMLDKNECPMNWWSENKFLYPYLSQLFLENNHKVVTSFPCERKFNKMDMHTEEKRNSLSSKITPKLVFLNGNIKIKPTN